MAGPAGLDAGKRVFEDGGLLGLHGKCPGAGEICVGRGLALQVLLLGHHTVDDLLEQVDDPRGLQDLGCVRARRDDGTAQTGVDSGAYVADRPLVRLDPLLVDHLEHQIVLAISDPVDRLVARRIGRAALRQLDAARFEE